MYTQCPECKQYRALTAESLRESQAMICCDGCAAMYDALVLLTEGDIPEENTEAVENSIEEPHHFQLEKKSSKYITLWKNGVLLCLMTLTFQIYYFEGYQFTQNSLIRPLLQKICLTLNCQLPVYKNLDEISIINGSFEVNADHSYQFKAAFINQSNFPQALPSIELTLQDFNGKTFAKRVFHPNEYIKNSSDLIDPNLSIEAFMSIAAPSASIGGYHFQLK